MEKNFIRQNRKDILDAVFAIQIWLDPPIPATDRVINMLLKNKREEYQSELVIPKSERAPIAPAIPTEELTKSK